MYANKYVHGLCHTGKESDADTKTSPSLISQHLR